MAEETGKRNINGNYSAYPGSSMKKSLSTNCLLSSAAGKTCICAPTKHERSFRCRLHRSSLTYHNFYAQTTSHPKPFVKSEADESNSS